MSSTSRSASKQKPPGVLFTQLQPPTAARSAALKTIKAAHTIVWALFAGCTIAIPFAFWLGKNRVSAWLIAIVFVECAVLVVNRWRCPLTSVAERYTTDRRANFDIYLPEWLARHNKSIFGAIYLVGIVFALAHWVLAAS
jgi:hypothetical protein